MDWVLRTHLGAGDGILQSGMAVALLDKFDEQLWFPCYPQYQTTFESIFVAYPRIRIFTVEKRPGEDWGSPRDSTYEQAQRSAGIFEEAKIIKCGVYNGRGCWEDFSKQFYHDAGVPYEARWGRCPVREASKSFNGELGFEWPEGKRRIFVHEDLQRRFRIWKRIPQTGEICIFKPSPDKVSTSLLAYAGLIESAEEIHCIDSAFFHLVDSLEPAARVFLHKYPRWQRSYSFRYENRLKWEYVD